MYDGYEGQTNYGAIHDVFLVRHGYLSVNFFSSTCDGIRLSCISEILVVCASVRSGGVLAVAGRGSAVL